MSNVLLPIALRASLAAWSVRGNETGRGLPLLWFLVPLECRAREESSMSSTAERSNAWILEPLAAVALWGTGARSCSAVRSRIRSLGGDCVKTTGRRREESKFVFAASHGASACSPPCRPVGCAMRLSSVESVGPHKLRLNPQEPSGPASDTFAGKQWRRGRRRGVGGEGV
eukprot:420322-Hanusia_phi.AAC.3